MPQHSFDEYGSFIDGEVHLSGNPFKVLNPSTNEQVASVSGGGQKTVNKALTSTENALSEWRHMEPTERGEILRDIADAIRGESEKLIRLGTAETGRPLSQSRLCVTSGVEYLEYYAGLTDKIEGESIPLGKGYLDYTRLEPLGITGQIIPWNVASLLSLRGIAPALACGNGVIAKPAPEAPLTAIEMTRIANEAGLPDGVWNIVPGDGATTGAALVESDQIDKIVFTGSVETAKTVMKSAAESLTPVGLETGGKSPSLVFSDADIDEAVNDTLNVFNMAGQVCFATTRVFVHEDIYDEFVNRIVAATEELTIGPGVEDPDIGPLISREARNHVAKFVDEAVTRDSGRILTGGKIPSEGGSFYEPTIIDNVPNDAPISRDEVFGPVFTLYPFSDEKNVIQKANDTRYGLYATVWTENLSRAHRVAHQLEAGTVSVNEFPVNPPQAPFGGYKQSGIGREKGVQAIDEYTQTKNIVISIDEK